MTSRNKLSRREREARTKIIQECNLNRQGQQALDRRYEFSGETYTEIRERIRDGSDYVFLLSVNRLAQAVRKIGTTAKETTNALRRLAIALAEREAT